MIRTRSQRQILSLHCSKCEGSILYGGLYCFGAAYLVSPLFGWHLDTPALVSAFGSLPMASKLAAKFAMAFPFTFHGVNGVGHLIWDTGRSFQRKQIVAQGWTILGLSFAIAVYLASWV